MQVAVPRRKGGQLAWAASRSSLRSLADGLLFLAPFMLVYALFMLAPVLQAVYISGFKWDLLGFDQKFVGVGNYVRMFGGTDIVWSVDFAWVTRLLVVAGGAGIAYVLWTGRASRAGAALTLGASVAIGVVLGFHPSTHGAWNDASFWISLQNTIEFTLLSTPLLVGLGLALALLVHGSQTRARGLYRSVFFLPYVLPVSAVTLVWSYLLNPDRGLIAGFLSWFGAHGISFLSDPNLAMPAIVATTVWWGVGFNLVLFLAGLQDIEPNLYEAASLDGAGYWRRFQHVTLPGLRHVTVLVAVTQLIASFQIFGQVYIMTRGGPGSATIVFIQQIYESGFKNYQLGYAAALSVVLFLVMAGASAIQFRLVAQDS
jgi:multiple sugar transport system permease protein